MTYVDARIVQGIEQTFSENFFFVLYLHIIETYVALIYITFSIVFLNIEVWSDKFLFGPTCWSGLQMSDKIFQISKTLHWVVNFSSRVEKQIFRHFHVKSINLSKLCV